MIEDLIAILAGWVIDIISTLGYPGIVVTMAIESALIPLPSEIIMPFSGYLVSQGTFTLWGVTLAGAVGNLIGSLVAYYIGFYGEEPLIKRFIRKFGKFILISEEEYEMVKNWVKKFGIPIIFFSRVMPAIRTVISLPCGIAKLEIKTFIVLTFFGSLIWSFFLAFIGKVLGDNWQAIGPYFHKFDVLIIAIVVIFLIFWIYHKFKPRKTNA